MSRPPFVLADPSLIAAVDRLLCAAAYGATLTVEPRALLCSGGGWVAKLDSGARYAEVEGDNLAVVLSSLAEKWSAL